MTGRLLHVAAASDWDAAVAAGGPYRAPSLDIEGFVHCSTDDQLAGTLHRHFAGVDRAGLVVLVIDPARVGADVRWELAADAAERFPHVYGPIELDAVETVRPVR